MTQNRNSMTLFTAIVFCLSTVAFAAEIELLEGHPPVKMAKGIELSADNDTLTIQATENLKVPVFVIERPAVPETGYILKGEVRHEDVGGDGMLEMWNHFPAVNKDGKVLEGKEGSFFSRTAGNIGPMRKLNGTSAWRPFILPFNPGDLGHSPNRLEVNALLPDGGTVMLKNLELVAWKPPGGPMANAAGKSIWVSVGSTIAVLFALGLFGLGYWLRRRHLEKELERIAIADTQI